MKLFKGLFLILFFAQTLAQAQELTLLKGKVTSQIKELNEVYIVNLRSDSNSTIDQYGNFSMFVKVGDSLRFSGLQIVAKKVKINENDLAKKLYVINVEAKVIPLEEVEVKTYPNINAVSLGILQKPAKVYTPAERKLKTASDLDGKIGFGGSMSLDPLLNALRGRTAMLKKELTVEKKEFLLKKIEYMFPEEYFLGNLKIPKEYLRGFWYYAVEDPKLEAALNSKNKIMARFIFSDLAANYLEILKK
jgi:hypothetical protein